MANLLGGLDWRPAIAASQDAGGNPFGNRRDQLYSDLTRPQALRAAST